MAYALKKTAAICLAGCLLFTAACTSTNPRDPYEGYNRAVFQFNEKADQYVMQPVARGYRKVAPKPVRAAATNFFNNLRDVKSFGSNVLRADIGKAGGDFMRVAFNTTFGLGGLLDLASAVGMPNNKNTFGDTLASWGWKKSHYFVVPFFGPSTVRDSVGNAVYSVYPAERFLFPSNAVRYSAFAVDAVNSRERLLDTTDALDNIALDKYVATREAYMSYRNRQTGTEQADDEADLFEGESVEESVTETGEASANEVEVPPVP